MDRAKKEVTVYEAHPGLEDTITLNGKKHRILYIHTPGVVVTYEDACHLTSRGDLEINTEYPLFKSKRYGDIFKKLYIIAAIARSECSSPDKMYNFILSHIDKEFRNF